MNCIVCFSETNDKTELSCPNIDCNSIICKDCYSMYFSITEKDNELPVCPNNKCKSLFNSLNVKQFLAKGQYIRYDNLIYEVLKRKNFEKIETTDNKLLIIDKIRKEREIFIEKSFPLAIKLTIDILLKKKMNKIDKDNIKFKKTIDKMNFSARCFNVYCTKGTTTEKKNVLECDTCFSNFCKSCEVKITDKKHICKKEDLKTLEYMANVIKCPCCKAPAEKINGCNYVTCNICKTKFLITDGTKTEYGGHPDNVNYNPVNKLSEDIKNEYSGNIINCIREIEEFKETNCKTQQEKLLLLILKIKNCENKDTNTKLKASLSRLYDKILWSKEIEKYFFRCMETIKEHHSNKELEYLQIKIMYENMKQL